VSAPPLWPALSTRLPAVLRSPWTPTLAPSFKYRQAGFLRALLLLHSPKVGKVCLP
jgi:hypothetical protein